MIADMIASLFGLKRKQKECLCAKSTCPVELKPPARDMVEHRPLEIGLTCGNITIQSDRPGMGRVFVDGKEVHGVVMASVVIGVGRQSLVSLTVRPNAKATSTAFKHTDGTVEGIDLTWQQWAETQANNHDFKTNVHT